MKQAGFVPVPPVNVVNATATPGAGHITLQWEAPEDVDYSIFNFIISNFVVYNSFLFLILVTVY